MAKKTSDKWDKLNDKQIIKTIAGDGIDTIFVIAPKNYKKMHVPLFAFVRFPPRVGAPISCNVILKGF